MTSKSSQEERERAVHGDLSIEDCGLILDGLRLLGRSYVASRAEALAMMIQFSDDTCRLCGDPHARTRERGPGGVGHRCWGEPAPVDEGPQPGEPE